MKKKYWDQGLDEICYCSPELATFEHTNIFVVDDFFDAPDDTFKKLEI